MQRASTGGRTEGAALRTEGAALRTEGAALRTEGAALRTSISATQAVSSAPRQMSTDSGMFDNPFRAGGDLSKDAEVIIDALKTGKLSVISNASVASSELTLPGVGDETDRQDQTNGGGTLVEPRERKNGEVEVQRGLVVTAKQAAVEHVVIPEKEQKCKCCVVQ